MSRRGWLPLWPLVLMVVNTGFLVLNAGSASYDLLRFAAALAINVLGLAVTVRAAVQRSVPARERRPWQWLVGYWTLQVLMGVMFIASSNGQGEEPKPVFLLIAVAAWVLSGIPTLACLLSFPMWSMTPPERIRFWFDIATVCGGGFIPLWFLVLIPALGNTVDSVQMITIIQPVEYLVLIFAVCAVMMRGGLTSPRHPLTFLLAGQVTIGAGVMVLGYQLATREQPGTYFATDLLMQGGAFLLVAAAVMQARGVGRGERRTTDSGSRRPTAIPYLALGLGYSILVAAAVDSATSTWIGMIAGALIMTGAVAGRQVVVLRENYNFVVRDTLTGLASRFALYDNLDRAVERSARTGRPAAVLLIDLDGFKPINDRLGHAAGDELLVRFGEALRKCVRSGDTAGRLGGDEFAVILPDVTDAAAAQRVADAIVAECATPFTAVGQQVVVGASIGISITEEGRPCTSQELLHRADVAMYKVKHLRGQRHVLHYDPSLDLDPGSGPEPAPTPGLDSAELAELDRLGSRITASNATGQCDVQS